MKEMPKNSIMGFNEELLELNFCSLQHCCADQIGKLH